MALQRNLHKEWKETREWAGWKAFSIIIWNRYKSNVFIEDSSYERQGYANIIRQPNVTCALPYPLYFIHHTTYSWSILQQKYPLKHCPQLKNCTHSCGDTDGDGDGIDNGGLDVRGCRTSQSQTTTILKCWHQCAFNMLRLFERSMVHDKSITQKRCDTWMLLEWEMACANTSTLDLQFCLSMLKFQTKYWNATSFFCIRYSSNLMMHRQTDSGGNNEVKLTIEFEM